MTLWATRPQHIIGITCIVLLLVVLMLAGMMT
jgi:type IV secretory pathway VirB3-like protein